MIQPPDYIRVIQPYVPGKPIEELERELGISHSIKLASNENPLGPSPEALAAIRDSFGDLNRYPDPEARRLRSIVADHFGVGGGNILFGNGSDELITYLVPSRSGGSTPPPRPRAHPCP